MSIHRYQMRNLWSDYARGGAGIAIGVGGWALAPTTLHVIVIFGALTALFLLFTMRTFARQRNWVELSDDSMSIGRSRREPLRWSDLNQVKIRYYATRRNRTNGWMVMTLAWPTGRVAIDSSIDGFDAIAAQVARAVHDYRIDLDSVSATNFAAMGLTAPAEDGPMPASMTEGSR